jgi:hypothetical protein
LFRQHLQTIATLATPLALPVVRYEGRLLGSQAPACILAAGLAPTTDFIAGALMAVERREPVHTLASPLSLSGTAFRNAAGGADIAAVELPPLWQFAQPAGAGFRMPAWVSQEILAPRGCTLEVPAAVSKEASRHARREAYTVEFSVGGAHVEPFYRDFYRPYVTGRFGTGALVVDAERFHAVSRGMTLALLRAGGEWVAGMLFRVSGSTLQLGWFGSRSMPAPAGASEVLDAGVIEYAARLGAGRAVLGHSRPSLADGVVRYKARFGAVMRATRFPQRVIGIDVRRPTAQVAEALNAARFVTFSGRRPGMRVLDFRPAL